MASHEGPGKSSDWITPPEIFVGLGPFDCDPCYPPNDAAQYSSVPLIDEATVFTEEENGLEHEWVGYVWMNPPFGRRNGIMPWLEKFVAHNDGIALVPNRTGSEWFAKYAPLVDCVCMVHPKVKFIQPDGQRGLNPSFGSILFGCGQKAVSQLLAYQGGTCLINPEMCDVHHENHQTVVEDLLAEDV